MSETAAPRPAAPGTSQGQVVHTLATLLEELAPECFEDRYNQDGDLVKRLSGILCRDTARELLNRLDAAGFDLVKRIG